MGLDPGNNDLFFGGAACHVCKDVIFGGITPFYVECFVFGLVRCPIAINDPPSGVFLLEQDHLNPCIWEALVGNWGFTWWLQADRTRMKISFAGFFNYFYHEPMLTCQSLFTNQTLCGLPNDYAEGGGVVISWGPGIGPV